MKSTAPDSSNGVERIGNGPRIRGSPPPSGLETIGTLFNPARFSADAHPAAWAATADTETAFKNDLLFILSE